MEIINKIILIISPEVWSNIFVSKHHYAVELSKRGNMVYFLNPPNKNKRTVEIAKTKFDNLFVIDCFPLFRGIRFFPKVVGFWLECFEKRRIENAIKVKFDIVWNFETSRFFYLSVWNKRTFKILHIVDLNQDFQTKEAASSADLCLCTTDIIKERLEKFNNKVYKIHHGYVVPEKTNPVQIEGKIKAGYVGSLDIPYFDWQTTLLIVEQNPTVNFYFIGPLVDSRISKANEEIFNKIIKKDNIHFLGAKSASEIPSFLASMDILLVLYKADEDWKQLASPHKMMDYLGAGKIVVASYTYEYRNLENLILMSKNNKELPQIFKLACEKIDEYNMEERQKERIEFAQNNSYHKQVNKIEKLILRNE